MFITWVVSACDLIRQFLKLAFQRVFVGVSGIRHGGSEESIDAVRRQWVSDRFTESADVPDRPSHSVPRGQVFRRQVSKQTPGRTAVSLKV